MERPELLDLLVRVSRLVDSVDREPAGRPGYHLDSMAMFDRCWSLLGAIHLLLRGGFTHEAMILARPLLTDSVALMEIAAADEQTRAKRRVGRELHALEEWEGTVREGARLTGEDVDARLEAFARKRRSLEAYCRRLGFEPPPHWKHDRAPQLLDQHGRADERPDLRVINQFVHGSSFVTSERYSQRDDGVVVVGVRDDAWVAEAAGLSAAHSALHAMRAYCRIAAVSEPEQVAALLAEVEANTPV
jgi:hypothetical protein